MGQGVWNRWLREDGMEPVRLLLALRCSSDWRRSSEAMLCDFTAGVEVVRRSTRIDAASPHLTSSDSQELLQRARLAQAQLRIMLTPY